ncbi:hypothetical protein [Dictyobacter kobayashii]|uniref:Uncharacterized protein n=1 Tax=Dictyobacter kobayashii TaxID=2014872 RepID=A0A402AI39_9CHLR|nr:hypothetical protein [Dictyobacter kobayashii]GCE18777.1 hypothetical protein KDK_25770 [Dictyobacter kobayashii]
MENERQPPSLPPRESTGQQKTTARLQDSQKLQTTKKITHSLYEYAPTQPQPPDSAHASDAQTRRTQTTMPPNYQAAIEDMGTSLGYGQGMEYQYSDVPQPSQLMLSQLRMANLQQKRYQQTRHQLQSKHDITHSFKKPQVTRTTTPLYSLMPPQEIVPAEEVIDEDLLQTDAKQDTGVMKKIKVGQATFILSGSFIASRVLGLVKTSLTAYILGQPFSRMHSTRLLLFPIPFSTLWLEER